MIAFAALKKMKNYLHRECLNKYKNAGTSSEQGFFPKRPFLAIANLCFE
jgi:hypothetical protein